MPKPLPYSRRTLQHALTEFDKREEERAKKNPKAHYNRFALFQYLGRIEDVDADILRGADPRKAILAAFTGNVLRAALRPFGWTATVDEVRGAGKGYTYQPETPVRGE